MPCRLRHGRATDPDSCANTPVRLQTRRVRYVGAPTLEPKPQQHQRTVGVRRASTGARDSLHIARKSRYFEPLLKPNSCPARALKASNTVRRHHKLQRLGLPLGRSAVGADRALGRRSWRGGALS